jgi:hypothetical protein
MKTIKLFNSFLLLTSFFSWLIFSFITSFTNLFTDYFSFFNYVHTISAFVMSTTIVTNQILFKSSRENTKRLVKEFFTTKQKAKEVAKKDIPERHCTKCKNKKKN